MSGASGAGWTTGASGTSGMTRPSDQGWDSRRAGEWAAMLSLALLAAGLLICSGVLLGVGIGVF